MGKSQALLGTLQNATETDRTARNGSCPGFRSALCALIVLTVLGAARPAHAQTFGCSPAMANDIVCENSKPGNPPSEWDTSGAGDLTIQGFATDISVNRGSTISFKINTNARAYTITIYRLGYYGGLGARKIATVNPSVSLPQTQPACLTDPTTNLADCGNWAVSASWTVPSNATSGVYIAHLVRTDTGGDSHIVFVVRNDASRSDILYQTSDTTWEAYNSYGPGGYSLYGSQDAFDLPTRALKVSYNRPFLTRGFTIESATWVFGAEFAMIQWLEQNGYDVTYFTGVDAARNGSLIRNHRVYMSTGHDEYWSGPQRANVEAARDAGVNLAFFSGNEVFWKVRWENSIDGTNTPYRTMVCYKETLAGAKTDPTSTWTGTWRDPTFSPPSDGGRPENALTGTIFAVNGPGADNDGTLAIKVPAADGKMRFWRNTAAASLAANQIYTLPQQTLGYEWDIDADNDARPAGAFRLSTTTQALSTDLLLDFGATYGAGTATHSLVMYRAPSGALVFGAGTVNWAWGLNSNHDDAFGDPQPPDLAMQQATLNLLADMHVQPATRQSGLVSASASTDTTPPTSRITSPSAGNITTGTPVTISGTAADTGGVVGGVEVSLDGGATWHPANGRGAWSYSWLPSELGTFTIKSRAVDDSGNIETPAAGVTVTVAPPDCPCNTLASTVPGTIDSQDAHGVELGVKFRTDFNGYITGIRFYKSTANTGTHIGNLWSSTGTLLARATFTNETASGWQQVSFSNPVAVTKNTTYIASYYTPTGHYSVDVGFFAIRGLDNPPLHFLANGVDGPNGVYAYGSGSSFPNQSFSSSSYWVDVVFMPSETMPGAPPALLANPPALSFFGGVGLASPASQQISLINEGTGTVTWTASKDVNWLSLSATSGGLPSTLTVSVNTSGLAAGNYTGTITINATGNIPTTTITVNLSLTNILLSSNFATGSMAGWAFSPLGLASNWSVVNGALHYNGGGHTQVYAGNSVWANYDLVARFKLATLNNNPGGIRGRVNPATGASYAVWMYPATGQVMLYKTATWNIDAGFTNLGQAALNFDTTNFHNLEMVFQGSQISVLYDGNTIITATDTTNASGGVAIDVSNQVVDYSSVIVTSGTASPAAIGASPSSLSYSATYHGANPASQPVQITGSGGTLIWTASSDSSWLTASPSYGTTPATLQAVVNSSALNGGTYSGTITVTSLGATNVTQTINVSLTVVVPPPTIFPAPSSMSFVAVSGQPAPPAQALSVTNAGLGSFSYTLSSNASWLLVSPTSGSTPGVSNVSVNQTGLASGSYNANVTITAPGIVNSPQAIPVTLQVLAQDLNENFANQAAGWVTSPLGNGSGWTVSSGVYSYNGQGKSQSCSGNAGWTNYILDANVKLSNGSNFPGGLRARVNPATGASYFVWLYPAEGLIKLWRVGTWNVDDASLTLLGSATITYDTTAFHDLQISVQGSQIVVSWDGISKITATDSTYSAGYICLDGFSQPISFSNIRVAAPQSAVILDQPSPASLTFSTLPGITPAPKTVNISAGGAATTWAAVSNTAWLSASTSSSLTPGTVTISANVSGLSAGTYSGSVSVYAPGATNSPLIIPVTLAVKTAVLAMNPSTLTFFGSVGVSPRPQNLQVTNSGTGSLTWSASAGSSWLGLSPTSGTAPSTLTATPNTTNLAAGTYTDAITLTSTDAGNSGATVGVNVQIGTLLFYDNFNTGAGNWTVGPLGFASGWSVSNGFYNYNGGGHTQSWAGNAAWSNYTVAADFRLASTSDYPGGIRGRLNPSTGASYGAWIYPGEGVIKLFRIGQWNIDTDLSFLGQSGQLNIDTNVHTIRLSFKGSLIQVYYDEVLVINAVDSSYAQGAVALDVSNQPISFTNVTVISLP